MQSDNATEPYRDRLDVGQRLRLPVEELAVLQPHVPVSNSFGQLIDRANKQHTYIHTAARTATATASRGRSASPASLGAAAGR